MDEADLSLAGIPFLHELGVELIAMADGQSEIALKLEPRHMNGWQVAHGGVVLTLLDMAMALAGRSLDPQARAGVTVEMKASFLQPAGKAGSRIIARGRVFHRSMTLCFCEAEVWAGDKLAAKGMGTFKFIRRLDLMGKLERDGGA